MVAYQRKTPDHHGYQVIIVTASSEYAWGKGKVYKGRKSTLDAVGRITCALDAGRLTIEDFRYCRVDEWYS